MHSLHIFALFAAVASHASSSAITSRENFDWKYSVGWDGTTLPAGDIGTPLPSNATNLEKRTIGGVYICTDIHWGGRCGYAVQALNQCIVLGNDWNKQISSFGPDPCTNCAASSYSNCGDNIQPTNGDSWSFTYPGDATGGIGTYTFPWNDQISSFRCWAATSCNGSPAGS